MEERTAHQLPARAQLRAKRPQGKGNYGKGQSEVTKGKRRLNPKGKDNRRHRPLGLRRTRRGLSADGAVAHDCLPLKGGRPNRSPQESILGAGISRQQ